MRRLDRIGKDNLEKMDRKREALLVWCFFALLVFGVVTVTGTLTSGFHLVDDWEFAQYTDQMTLGHMRRWVPT